MSNKKKFYNTNWFMWLTLIFFAPIGIFIMWRNKKFSKPIRSVLSVVFAFMFIGAMGSESADTGAKNNDNKNIVASDTVNKENSTKDNKPKETTNKSSEVKNDISADKAVAGTNSVSNTVKATVKIQGNLKVHYIDVGQADSILIQQNGHNMLIDAGNNADSSLVVNYLKKQGVSKLDYVIGTHPHEDHIGGLDVVIKSFNIGKVFMPKKTSTTQTYKDVGTAIKSKGLNITVPTPNTTYDLGEAKWTMLAPGKDKDYEDTNNYSIVCKLKYGNTSFIFTGDAEAIPEMEMVKAGYDLKADVLKVGHHGSKSSTCVNFLNAVNPKYAVVSVGKDNKYGHPHKSTMDRLKAKNIPVYRIDECGTIVATSDGTKITFSTKPGDYKYNGTGTSTKSNNSSIVNKSTSTTKSSTNNSNTSTKSSTNNSNTTTKSSTNNSNTTTKTNTSTTSSSKTVYWTPKGKSYHYTKKCSTLSRSKTILDGPLSECPKSDPCDRCTH